MDLATFRIIFPETRPLTDPFIQAHLDLAANELDPLVFGARFDTAHGYYTAHRIAISPAGRTAKLQTKSGTWLAEYEAILEGAVCMVRVGFGGP